MRRNVVLSFQGGNPGSRSHARRPRVTVVTTWLSGQSNDGVRVGVRPHTGLAALEDFPLRDPVARQCSGGYPN